MNIKKLTQRQCIQRWQPPRPDHGKCKLSWSAYRGQFARYRRIAQPQCLSSCHRTMWAYAWNQQKSNESSNRKQNKKMNKQSKVKEENEERHAHAAPIDMDTVWQAMQRVNEQESILKYTYALCATFWITLSATDTEYINCATTSTEEAPTDNNNKCIHCISERGRWAILVCWSKCNCIRCGLPIIESICVDASIESFRCA